MVTLPFVEVTPCIVLALGSKIIILLKPISRVPLALAFAVKLRVARTPLVPVGALVCPVRL